MNEHLRYIEALANRALESVNCAEAPVPLDKIAEKLELKIVPFDFPDTISGILKKEKKVIGVNQNHSLIRRRFTIAHEIGHFLLHHDHEDELDGQFDKPSSIEREANVFASCLLMPRNWVIKKVQENGLDTKNLAREFKVSEQAMTVRLLELDQIR